MLLPLSFLPTLLTIRQLTIIILAQGILKRLLMLEAQSIIPNMDIMIIMTA